MPPPRSVRPVEAAGGPGGGGVHRYGEASRPNPIAAGLALLLTAVLIAALVHSGIRHAHTKATRLAVVNLSMAPPPPPPAPAETPPPPQPRATMPQPLVVLPNPRPVQIAVPDPEPAAPIAVSVPAAPPAPPAPPSPPSTIQADDLATRMLSGPPPRYPTESRRHREQGTVLLSVTLGVDGSVAAISVARTSGFQRLDEAALRAVRKWRWAPTICNGEAVRVKGVVEIPFVLRG